MNFDAFHFTSSMCAERSEAAKSRLKPRVNISDKIQCMMKSSKERKDEARNSYKCNTFAVPTPAARGQPCTTAFCFLTDIRDPTGVLDWSSKAVTHLVEVKDGALVRNKYCFTKVSIQSEFALTDQLKRKIVEFVGGAEFVFCCASRGRKQNLESISAYLVSLNSRLADHHKRSLTISNWASADKETCLTSGERLENDINVITATPMTKDSSTGNALSHFIVVNICDKALIRGFAELLKNYQMGRSLTSRDYMWARVAQCMRRKCDVMSFVFSALADIYLVSLFATHVSTNIEEVIDANAQGISQPQAVGINEREQHHLAKTGQAKMHPDKNDVIASTADISDCKYDHPATSRGHDTSTHLYQEIFGEHQPLRKPTDILKIFMKQRKTNQEFFAANADLENDPTTGNDIEHK